MKTQKSSSPDQSRPEASPHKPRRARSPHAVQQRDAAEKATAQGAAAGAATPIPSAAVADLATAHPPSPPLSPPSAGSAKTSARSRRRSDTAAATNDDVASDVLLDQYYTRLEVAAYLYRTVQLLFDLALFLIVEPSAGMGSFYRLFPFGSLGYDVDPKYPGILKADFLTVQIKTDRKIAVIGNPPFGRNSNMAIDFFNHAARQAHVIAMILPRTFRKPWAENQLDRAFHLLREETVPDNAFLFRGKPFNVPTVFQIWERRPEKRALRIRETRHPDFEFTTADLADFAIQRVGAQAGRVHRGFKKSKKSHYFIRGDVENIMVQLRGEFSKVAGDVAGNPSLAKAEIVSLYREWLRSGSPRPILAQLGS